jgi:hypothetical protein
MIARMEDENSTTQTGLTPQKTTGAMFPIAHHRKQKQTKFEIIFNVSGIAYNF